MPGQATRVRTVEKNYETGTVIVEKVIPLYDAEGNLKREDVHRETYEIGKDHSAESAETQSDIEALRTPTRVGRIEAERAAEALEWLISDDRATLEPLIAALRDAVAAGAVPAIESARATLKTAVDAASAKAAAKARAKPSR